MKSGLSMMKKSCKVDLTKIEGEGDFPCPKCGTSISPEDETENVYTIIDVIEDDDGLESLIIRCNKCSTVINLDGLEALSQEDLSGIEISEALSESETDIKTYHVISRESKSLGHLTVEYAQKEDVEAFKRLRRLHVGEPFRSVITVECTENTNFNNEDYREIAKAVKRRFKGLSDNDIYVVEMKAGEKNIVGRVSSL